MPETLPIYAPILFALTALATLALFYRAIRQSPSGAINKHAGKITVALAAWMLVQALLTLNNVYSSDPDFLPPKIVLLGIAPTIGMILLMFVTRSGRRFIDAIPLTHLTLLHTVRIPVEMVLWWLFVYKAVPELMTFEGRNFDILAGITAPFAAYCSRAAKRSVRRALLVWNVLCLGLLLNIVVNALLAAPSPFQQFAFEQPNIAIVHFPFSWLPTMIVPLVLFSHLVAIRQLLKQDVPAIRA